MTLYNKRRIRLLLLSGFLYEVNGYAISARVSLFKGQKERIYQFELRSDLDKKEILAGKIVEEVQKFLNK